MSWSYRKINRHRLIQDIISQGRQYRAGGGEGGLTPSSVWNVRAPKFLCHIFKVVLQFIWNVSFITVEWISEHLYQEEGRHKHTRECALTHKHTHTHTHSHTHTNTLAHTPAKEETEEHRWPFNKAHSLGAQHKKRSFLINYLYTTLHSSQCLYRLGPSYFERQATLSLVKWISI